MTVMTSGLLSYKHQIETFLKQTPYALSSFSFVNIFIWSDFFDFTFKVVDDSLCIFAENPVGMFLYLPPLGPKMSLNALDESMRRMTLKNNASGVTRVENIEEDARALFDPDAYTIFKRSEEFIYSRQDIVALSGKAFKSKRSSYNHFVKNNVFTFAAYEQSAEQECLQLYERWAAQKKNSLQDDIALAMIEENRVVHRKAIHHFKELGLIGRIVRVGEGVVGYTFGFELKPDVFCVLFEITDLQFSGLSSFIFRALCADAQVQKYPRINAMDDFGLATITQAKELFRPRYKIQAYSASPKRRT